MKHKILMVVSLLLAHDHMQADDSDATQIAVTTFDSSSLQRMEVTTAYEDRSEINCNECSIDIAMEWQA